jgi:hypothetical protein
LKYLFFPEKGGRREGDFLVSAYFSTFESSETDILPVSNPAPEAKGNEKAQILFIRV